MSYKEWGKVELPQLDELPKVKSDGTVIEVPVVEQASSQDAVADRPEPKKPKKFSTILDKDHSTAEFNKPPRNRTTEERAAAAEEMRSEILDAVLTPQQAEKRRQELIALLPLLPFPDARPNQRPPDQWDIDPVENWVMWIILAGRGFGKSRTGAEWIVQQCISRAGLQAGVCAQTWNVVKGVCVEGPAGILSICKRRKIKVVYNKTDGTIAFANGSMIRMFSAETPDRPRGYQFHIFWMDEWCAWANIEEITANIRMGTRLTHDDGLPARTLITTTPKPLSILRKMVASPFSIVVKGATRDNRHNLDPSFYAQMVADYSGSDLGRQELEGEILDDTSGLLFDHRSISYYSRPEGTRLFKVGDRYIDWADCRWFTVVDVAGNKRTQADWTVASVYAFHGRTAELFLADVVRAKLAEEQHYKLVLGIVPKYPEHQVYVESSMYSTTVMRDLALHLPREYKVIPLDPRGEDKIARALPAAAMARDGRIFFPQEHPLCQITTSLSERKSVIDELLEFPLYNDHDDFVDTLGYAVRIIGRDGRWAKNLPGERDPDLTRIEKNNDFARIKKYVSRVEAQKKRRNRWW